METKFVTVGLMVLAMAAFLTVISADAASVPAPPQMDVYGCTGPRAACQVLDRNTRKLGPGDCFCFPNSKPPKNYRFVGDNFKNGCVCGAKITTRAAGK